MIQNCLPSRGHSTCFSIGKQEAVLFCHEKTRGNSIHPYLNAILLCHMHCQPLRKVSNSSFCRAIGGYTGQRTKRIHRGNIHDTAMSLLYHAAPEDLATLESPCEIQVKYRINGLSI